MSFSQFLVVFVTNLFQGYTVFSIPVGVVYRPNEAKVRNLKTKDYLGKARLVAASDRSNAFTGFAGSEIKSASTAAVKDDRPVESLSFAATNLVKPGLQSRRQQSEPPNSRNVFPPTPPPENDKQPSVSRGASVRNGPKPVPSKLNLEKARPNDRYAKETQSPDDGQQRRPSRSASVNNGPSRGYSQREPPRRQRSIEEEEEYPDLYDMYQGGNGGGSRGSRAQQGRRGPAQYIEEEEGSDYEDASFDEGDFEMVSNRRGPGSVSGASRRSTSKRVVPTKVRIKVHAAADVRYIMVGTAVEFPDLVSSIQAKFGLRRRFKIKVKDDDSDGDMVTMGDQDDLEMIMQTVTENAKRQRLDTGKLEVCLCVILQFGQRC